MKKLKTYSRFLESNSEHLDEVISVLNDMCLELRDNGFLVDPLWNAGSVAVRIPAESQKRFTKSSDVISIGVIKSNSDATRIDREIKRFHFEDIKGSILEMIEYMKSEGFSITKIEFVDASGVINGLIKDGNLYTELTDIEVSHLIGSFLIEFTKYKINESSLSERPMGSESEYSFEEDRDFISDTLLELEDKGFTTLIRNSGLSTDIGISKNTPYFIIGSNNHFKFSDVKEELLQIKSYLGDRWFKCGVVFECDPIRLEVYIDEKGYDHLDDWFHTSTSGIVNLVVFFNI